MAGFRRIKRGPQLIDKLKRLRTETAAAIRPALMAAAQVVVAEQKRLAPEVTGKLRDSIQANFGQAVRHSTFQGGGNRSNEQVRISAGNDKVRYAHLVEFGTAPHTITAVNAPALRLHGGIFVESVEHPGAQAKPFFYPGYRATRKQARRIINKAVREAVKKAVK